MPEYYLILRKLVQANATEFIQSTDFDIRGKHYFKPRGESIIIEA